jgi:hypothetical protein
MACRDNHQLTRRYARRNEIFGVAEFASFSMLSIKPVVTVLPIKLGMIAKHGLVGGLQK